MLDVKIEFDDIKIVNIEKKHIASIFNCMESKNYDKNVVHHPLRNIKELEDTFIEYYFNECEFFLEIIHENSLIGLIKGRAEFKNPNEIWILYFLKHKYKFKKETWHKILFKLEEYFFKQYGIDSFYVIIDNNSNLIDIFKNNGFSFLRIYEKDKNNNKQFILKKERYIRT